MEEWTYERTKDVIYYVFIREIRAIRGKFDLRLLFTTDGMDCTDFAYGGGMGTTKDTKWRMEERDSLCIHS